MNRPYLTGPILADTEAWVDRVNRPYRTRPIIASTDPWAVARALVVEARRCGGDKAVLAATSRRDSSYISRLDEVEAEAERDKLLEYLTAEFGNEYLYCGYGECVATAGVVGWWANEPELQADESHGLLPQVPPDTNILAALTGEQNRAGRVVVTAANGRTTVYTLDAADPRGYRELVEFV